MSLAVQTVIYALTVGTGARLLRLVFVLILIGAIGGFYDILAFRNFANREAMDMAQVGKNLAEGKGYTTLCVRPFSMFLVEQHRADHSPEIKTMHPDVTNPPVYPVLLAALFKVLPAKYFTAPTRGFSVAKPDLAVALVNQMLLLLAAVLIFLLGEKLFDGATAWVTAIVFVGTDILWRFSVSGLNTMLLIAIFLVLVWCLVWLEQWMRHGKPDRVLVSLAGTAGLLVGLGALTRYAFGWMIIPVLIYLIAFFGRRRAMLGMAAVAGLLVMVTPWMVRTYSKCGAPFGTATFTVCQGTGTFPEDRLERSLHPSVHSVGVGDLSRKLFQNSRELVQHDLPRLGGSWVTAFFLVGLLVPFRAPGPSRLRVLFLLSLLVLMVVQVMGRTSLSDETPDVNSDNMLVLLTPLVFLFGTALFLQLLGNLAAPQGSVRLAYLSGFCILASLPLVQTLLPPRQGPIAYPPYYPPLFQRIAGWYNEQELIMSDIPWALAYYGRRQTVWMTLNWKKDFAEIADYQKPVKAIYLTAVTTDTKFLTSWIKGQNQSWTSFMLESMLQREVPTGFPLRRAPEGWFPEQILLTDFDRWKLKAE